MRCSMDLYSHRLSRPLHRKRSAPATSVGPRMPSKQSNSIAQKVFGRAGPSQTRGTKRCRLNTGRPWPNFAWPRSVRLEVMERMESRVASVWYFLTWKPRQDLVLPQRTPRLFTIRVHLYIFNKVYV